MSLDPIAVIVVGPVDGWVLVGADRLEEAVLARDLFPQSAETYPKTLKFPPNFTRCFVKPTVGIEEGDHPRSIGIGGSLPAVWR